MLIIITFLLLILYTTVSKLYYSSLYLSGLLFIFLFLFLTYNLAFRHIYKKYTFRVSELILKFTITLKSLLTRRNVVLIILCLMFLAGLSKSYYLGGDDTKLFYVYPKDYLINFASSVFPGNSVSGMVGFLPSSSIYYFALFLTFLKTILPFINLQSMLYTANILFGIFFFYLLLDYIFKEAVKYKTYIYLLSSFLYTFSIFNIYILYNARLIAIYLISIFPLSVYLFLRAVRERKSYLIFLIAILWTVFCFISAASLWFLPAIIVVLPVISYLVKDNVWSALKNILLLGFLLVIFNIHWIYFLPYTTLFGKGGTETNNATSQQFREESSSGLRSMAVSNDLFFPLNNLFHYQIQINNRWPYLPVFTGWYLKLIPLTSIFILTIIAAGFYRKRDFVGKFYTVSLFSLILGLYFFTVNVGNTKLGNWGIELYVWLCNDLTGFVAFRNMYDKFGYALSFAFSLALAAALFILAKSLKSESFFKKLLAAIFVVSVLIFYPYISGQFRNLPVWKTQNSFYTTTGFNKEYFDLTEYIKSQDDVGRYLTLPLSGGNIAFIQDNKLPNHYYVGVSPLLILTGKNDYSGSLSFGAFADDFNTYMKNKNYEGIGKVLQETNTKYIITNNTISKDMQNNYLLNEGRYEMQNDLFFNTILGEKIKDFGDKYTIYAINQKYDSAKIFIENTGGIHKKVNYKKISDTEYEVEISSLDKGEKLVFLDPFFDNWQLYSDDKMTNLDLNNVKYSNWANSWVFEADNITKFRIIFTPSKAKYILRIISSGAILISLLYIFVSFRKNKYV